MIPNSIDTGRFVCSSTAARSDGRVVVHVRGSRLKCVAYHLLRVIGPRPLHLPSPACRFTLARAGSSRPERRASPGTAARGRGRAGQTCGAGTHRNPQEPAGTRYWRSDVRRAFPQGDRNPSAIGWRRARVCQAGDRESEGESEVALCCFSAGQRDALREARRSRFSRQRSACETLCEKRSRTTKRMSAADDRRLLAARAPGARTVRIPAAARRNQRGP